MPVDPVLAAVMRNIAQEFNSLRAELDELRSTVMVYQRGVVVSGGTSACVVSLRGVNTNPLRCISGYVPTAGDHVMIAQVGPDMVIIGKLG